MAGASKNGELGERGEDAACAYLERMGLAITDRNWRTRSGELDIIGWDGDTLVVIEVKTRKTIARGTPEEAVTPAKQRRLTRLARAYLATLTEEPASVRFDVVTIFAFAPDKALLRHHRNAFEAAG